VILKVLKQIVSDDFSQSYVQNLLKHGIADSLAAVYSNVANLQINSEKVDFKNDVDLTLIEQIESSTMKLIYACCKAMSGVIMQGRERPEIVIEAKSALENAKVFSCLLTSILKRLLAKKCKCFLNSARVLFIIVQLYGIKNYEKCHVTMFLELITNLVNSSSENLESLKLIVKAFRRYVKLIQIDTSYDLPKKELAEFPRNRLEDLFLDDSQMLGFINEIFL